MAALNGVLTDAPRINEMPADDTGDFETEIDGVLISRRGENVVVDFAPGADRAGRDDSEGHSGNLCSQLPESELANLASKIIEYVDVDIESRKDWQRRIDQAMELMGLNNIPMDSLPFDGASAVTYPLIGEAVVQFQARAIEEIFPSDGPAKVKIVGERTPDREAQAERVREHMNYQMLDQDRSYFWQTDMMLFYLPLGGSAFKKTYFDPIQQMTVSRFVRSSDFIVPYVATDLASAPRYTHRMIKTDSEMKKLFASGFYREVPLMQGGWLTDTDSNEQAAIDKADSRTASTHYDDNKNTLLECHIDLSLSCDEGMAEHPLPYIVTVLKETQQVIGVRRNWKEGDQTFRKRIYFTHYRYLPGFGFYGFGLLHLIGSVAEATSSSIRALLDSAAFANMQGGYASSDAKFKPGDERIAPGVYKQVNMTAEELARAFYTPPFREPSAALARLFEALVQAGKSFTSTTEAMTGEAPTTAPVGTTIAMIEQGSKVFSGIHRRLHMAAAEEFSLRAELNHEFLPDEYPYEVEGGAKMVLRQDYDGRVDVIPVSDPNIFSTAQRIAQGQALIELSAGSPDLYDRRKVHIRFLKSIRVADPEDLLLPEQEVKRCDAITENAKMLTGRPAKAFVEQDHDAHIAAHMNFMAGLNKDALQIVGMPMQAHLAEHYAMKYYVQMNRMANGQLPPLQLDAAGEEAELPPEADAMMSQFAAQAGPIQLMPPDEEGPDAEQQAAMAEEQRKQMAFEAEQARKQQEHELELQRSQEKFEAELERDNLRVMMNIDREDQSAAAKQRREDAMAQVKAKTARGKTGGKGTQAK